MLIMTNFPKTILQVNNSHKFIIQWIGKIFQSNTMIYSKGGARKEDL
jgi:hypothetical protein